MEVSWDWRAGDVHLGALGQFSGFGGWDRLERNRLGVAAGMGYL